MNQVRRLRLSALFVIVFTCVAASYSWCQSSSIADQVASQFKGKLLLLRGFYSGNDLQYDQNGALRATPPPVPWTLAHVEITKINATPHGISIVGNRMGTLYRHGKPTFVKVGKLQIEVTTADSNVGTDANLHELIREIFLEPGEDLRSVVPEYWQSYLAGRDSKSRSDVWRATFERLGDQVYTKPGKAEHVTAPQVIYHKDPAYTKEAASLHIEGVSTLGAIVEKTGLATNIVILEPVGMGLDEQGILAVKQWKFRPAMKSGQPVRVEIEIQMDFRCCP